MAKQPKVQSKEPVRRWAVTPDGVWKVEAGVWATEPAPEGPRTDFTTKETTNEAR